MRFLLKIYICEQISQTSKNNFYKIQVESFLLFKLRFPTHILFIPHMWSLVRFMYVCMNVCLLYLHS